MKRPFSAVLTSFLILLSAGALTACQLEEGQANTKPGREPAPLPLSNQQDWGDAASISDKANEVGVALIKAAGTGAGAETNTVVSPAGLQLTLAALAPGARGQTRGQIEALIGAGGTKLAAALAQAKAPLVEFGGDLAIMKSKDMPKVPVLALSSRAVLDKQLQVNQEYLNILQRDLGVEGQTLDFSSPQAKANLDAWAREKTGGLVEESAVNPNSQTRLVLQNALAFAASWVNTFAQDQSMKRDFTLADGTKTQVETMSGVFSAPYAQTGGWQGLRAFFDNQDVKPQVAYDPYGAGQNAASGENGANSAVGSFYADFILPPKGKSPADISPQILAELNQHLRLEEKDFTTFQVLLPKVKVKSNLMLPDILQKLGMRAAFDATQADFSAISDQPLSVDEASQQGVLIISEKGAKAAALTEIAVREAAAPQAPEILAFDRPYLVRIAHQKGDWPLFLAAINNPGAS